jgi:hypothetical protein
MTIDRMLAVAAAVLVLTVQSVAAQDWQGRKRGGGQHQQQQQQTPQPQFAPPAGGACSPSGFARLSRNCSVNTGGCQRMPETCNRGWCCP